MSASIKTLGIDQLSIEDRLKLLDELWASIASESEAIPLTEAQRAELDRRIADHEANPDDVVAWEDVKSEIESKLKKCR